MLNLGADFAAGVEVITRGIDNDDRPSRNISVWFTAAETAVLASGRVILDNVGRACCATFDNVCPAGCGTLLRALDVAVFDTVVHAVPAADSDAPVTVVDAGSVVTVDTGSTVTVVSDGAGRPVSDARLKTVHQLTAVAATNATT